MKVICLAMLVAAAAAVPAHAQSRVEQYASDFSKFKSVTKHKKGVTTHKYKDVVAEPWLATIGEYAGHYVADERALDVSQRNGQLRVAGSDPEPFQLRNARISAGILSGAKVYGSGRTEAFEAAFLLRRNRDEPNQPFTTVRGLGIKIDVPGNGVIDDWQRVFLEKQ